MAIYRTNFNLGVPGDGPVPRIAETFKKKGWQEEEHAMDRNQQFRVTGFYKTWVPKSHKRTLTDDLLDEIKAEERTGMTPSQLDSLTREIKIIPCSREEAEFVSGAGVCGSILRLQDVEVTGIVSWDDRVIARARREYNPDSSKWPTTWHRYWDV